jgi:hypothetical protein
MGQTGSGLAYKNPNHHILGWTQPNKTQIITENFLFFKWAKLGRVWPIKIQTITYWAGRSPINHKSSHIGLDSAQPPRLG